MEGTINLEEVSVKGPPFYKGYTREIIVTNLPFRTLKSCFTSVSTAEKLLHWLDRLPSAMTAADRRFSFLEARCAKMWKESR